MTSFASQNKRDEAVELADDSKSPRRRPAPAASVQVSDRPATPAESQLSHWMQIYQEGDPAAFERLYEFLGPMVRRYLAWRVFDRSLTDDLLQEVFLQLHRARATYLAPRPVRPWVLGIARNVALMSLRKQHRTPEVIPLEGLDLPVPDALRDHFEEAQVRRALAALPEGRREAILLHHVWGLTFAEVAGVLGISTGAARVRAHRGLSELRQTLAEGGTPHSGGLAGSVSLESPGRNG